MDEAENLEESNSEQLRSLLAIDGNRESLIKLQHQYNAGLVSPFIGAGMSAPFGFPLWDAMLKKIAEDVGLTGNPKFLSFFRRS